MKTGISPWSYGFKKKTIFATVPLCTLLMMMSEECAQWTHFQSTWSIVRCRRIVLRSGSNIERTFRTRNAIKLVIIVIFCFVLLFQLWCSTPLVKEPEEPANQLNVARSTSIRSAWLVASVAMVEIVALWRRHQLDRFEIRRESFHPI